MKAPDLSVTSGAQSVSLHFPHLRIVTLMVTLHIKVRKMI